MNKDYKEDFSKYNREELEILLNKCFDLMVVLGSVYYLKAVFCVSNGIEELPLELSVPTIFLQQAHEILEEHSKIYGVLDKEL